MRDGGQVTEGGYKTHDERLSAPAMEVGVPMEVGAIAMGVRLMED